jgi:hypothetical protein
MSTCMFAQKVRREGSARPPGDSSKCVTRPVAEATGKERAPSGRRRPGGDFQAEASGQRRTGGELWVKA